MKSGFLIVIAISGPECNSSLKLKFVVITFSIVAVVLNRIIYDIF